MHVDHVGIATTDSEQLASLYGELLDAPVAHEETFGDLLVTFLDCGNGYLELLEPIDDEGTVAGFIASEGPGIHHVAFATENIEAALETARDLDVECIDEEPREGAWGHDVAFLHPRDTGGVLVEFVEH